MPKFLDVPQWYLTDGTQVNGVGCQNLYGITAIAPATCTVNGDLKSLAASVNNSSQGFNIYAPIAAGTAGQFLKSNGSGAPRWTSYYMHNITMQISNDSGDFSGFFINVRVVNNSTSAYNFSSLWEYINSYYAGISDAAVKCYPAVGVGWTGSNPNAGLTSVRTVYGLGITTISAIRYFKICSGSLSINKNAAPYVIDYTMNDNQLFGASEVTTINDVVISI